MLRDSAGQAPLVGTSDDVLMMAKCIRSVARQGSHTGVADRIN